MNKSKEMRRVGAGALLMLVIGIPTLTSSIDQPVGIHQKEIASDLSAVQINALPSATPTHTHDAPLSSTRRNESWVSDLSATRTTPIVGDHHGRLPLAFEANVGQTHEDVKFLARWRDARVFFAPAEVVLVLPTPTGELSGRDAPRTAQVDDEEGQRPVVLRMRLIDSNPKPAIEGLRQLPGKTNYLRGRDPKNWHTGIPSYAQVIYRQVYPSIDLIFYGNHGRLEFDFNVGPDADPSVVKMAFEGAESTATNRDGDLVIQAAGGALRMHKPAIYQDIDNERSAVAGGYVMSGKNEVGFLVTKYDVGKPLIIDPVLSYSTYLGSGNVDEGVDVAVDSAGNAYVTGVTKSVDFPTANPLQRNFAGPLGAFEVFVSKLNSSGLVYSTYIGGSDLDESRAISVDASANAYIVGRTRSRDFPRAAVGGELISPQTAIISFLLKLSANGTSLTYSMLFAANARALAIDSSGSAYVAGDFLDDDIATEQPFQGGPCGNCCFVAKVNPQGSAFVYARKLGAGDATGIAVDRSGHAYVTGHTTSHDFPTKHALRPVKRPFRDAFLAKFSPDGSDLVYSTYLNVGAEDFDIPKHFPAVTIAVDSTSSPYVLALSNGSGPDQATNLGLGPNCFDPTIVTKLNPSGSEITYQSCIGRGVRGSGISVDQAGNAYITGRVKAPFATSVYLPTIDPIQTTYGGGGGDAFVITIDVSGSSLLFSTFLGGTNTDSGTGIALDDSGNIYVAGITESDDFPTADAFQANLGGSSDAFVVNISSMRERSQADREDFNGDGKDDLLWRNAVTGANVVWHMDGPTRLAGRGIGAVADLDWEVAGISDYNGDGKSDILWRHAMTGSNALWLMDGLSRLDGRAVAGVPDFNWEVAGSGDYDGDSKADILWRHLLTGANVIWLMDGFTRLEARGIPPVVDTNWRIVGTGDCNGDGKSDILWRHAITGANAVWLMSGFTRAAAGGINPVGDMSWRIVGTGDYDGDQKSDILWRHALTGANVLWRMDGLKRVSARHIGAVRDTDWQIVGDGDYNGDGNADILWRNFSTGANAIWLMDGFTRLSARNIPSVTDLNSHVVPARD